MSRWQDESADLLRADVARRVEALGLSEREQKLARLLHDLRMADTEDRASEEDSSDAG